MTMRFLEIYAQLIPKEKGGKLGTLLGKEVYFYTDLKKPPQQYKKRLVESTRISEGEKVRSYIPEDIEITKYLKSHGNLEFKQQRK